MQDQRAQWIKYEAAHDQDARLLQFIHDTFNNKSTDGVPKINHSASCSIDDCSDELGNPS